MKKPWKLLFIFGTRPEIIKLAPVILEARKRAESCKVSVLHTGQHSELADEMLDLFQIKPEFDLKVMSPNQSLFTVSTRILEGLEKVLQHEKFDMIFVQGDTTTAFFGALAGFYTKTPVAHVEAGLRTNNRFNPYPEEMNRRLVSPLAELHFPPTERAAEALRCEGIDPERIVVTGNTVIDALLWAVEIPHQPSAELEKVFALPHRLILVTTHRRESFGKPHQEVFGALRTLVESVEDIQILFPVHPNPNVREQVANQLGNHPRITLCAPLGYLDFINAMKKAHIILSDSGGIQEEAPSLKKPVLVLRETTERPEGLATGALKLVGTSKNLIIDGAMLLLSKNDEYHRMTKNSNPYGDGRAAARILDAVLNRLKGTH